MTTTLELISFLQALCRVLQLKRFCQQDRPGRQSWGSQPRAPNTGARWRRAPGPWRSCSTQTCWQQHKLGSSHLRSPNCTAKVSLGSSPADGLREHSLCSSVPKPSAQHPVLRAAPPLLVHQPTQSSPLLPLPWWEAASRDTILHQTEQEWQRLHTP